MTPLGVPFTGAAVVTPSDTAELRFAALYVGVSGTVTVVTLAGQTVQFTHVPVGYLWIAGTKVMATGTAATEIVALS